MPFGELREGGGSAFPDLLRGRLRLVQGGETKEEAYDSVRPRLGMHADVFENIRCGGFEHLPDLSGQVSIAWGRENEMNEVHEAIVLFEVSANSFGCCRPATVLTVKAG
ncbi:hypothetical protein [Streptomyces sp. AC602_WCS936]|uniref:hypothetical protein n=1 Tax=Streptomyces sp. AC602_WCS936 TaxID=2823685 RepID=UPI001C27E754|nr:hypothetical protein [Streptomyces sp. AC602_WCS936]